MQQYFLMKSIQINDVLEMDKEQSHHIANVMRMKPEEKIRIADGFGHVYLAHVMFKNKKVFAVVDEEIVDITLPNISITLAQGLIKKEKWDFLLQKCAELGVSRILPFVSSRCVVKAKEDRQDKKKERWNKILLEACEQCKRSTLVELEDTCSFSALKNEEADLKLIAYENADRVSYKLSDIVKQHPNAKSAVVVIGCEGGFSLEEVEELEHAGYQRVSLGSRILRAETAAMSMIDRIGFYYDEMAGELHAKHGDDSE